MFIANHHTGRNSHYSVAYGWLLFAALGLPIAAHAQFYGKASATTQYESNSNVVALQSGFSNTGPGFNGGRRSDTDYSYGGELDGTYLWGRQELYAIGTARQYNYQHFTDLDHNEYTIDVGMNWKAAEIFDGKLDVLRTRTMVPLYDLTGSTLALALNTTQQETASLGVKVAGDWKLQGSVSHSKGEEPLPGAPELQLTQTTYTGWVNYGGFGDVSLGFGETYVVGDYGGGSSATGNPSYRQGTLGFQASYKANPRTTFDGSVGYSRRVSDDGTDNSAGITGAVDVTRQLTPKTSVSLKIDRAINSYYLNTGSEVDTEVVGGVNWQATYKLAVSAGYQFTYRDFPSQNNDPTRSNRIDRQQFATLSLSYQPRRWLTIRGYGNYQTRSSNFEGGDYNASIIGISVTVSSPDRRPKR
ncbi:MAG TPA: outer membrane beta-barrel protein [Steroidobacteraceae bacterium]|nr:outer membrane beta-barrel protein [Steroidobacteraceae bacterium]